eukprot:SAG25_NODE_1854_length_2251_cov_19.366171_2_plen_100_part_00
MVPPAPKKRTAHAQLFHLAGKHQELKERGVRVVLKAPVAPDPRLHPIVEAAGRWCRRGLRGHFHAVEVLPAESSISENPVSHLRPTYAKPNMGGMLNGD